MAGRGTILAMGTAALAAVLGAPAFAETIHHRPNGLPLQAVIDRSAAGDVIVLAKGEHAGPITLDRTLTIEGEPGAVVAGNGKGSVITVTAAQSVVRGLEITGSGKDLSAMDSAVFVAQTAAGTRVEDNRITGNLVGIYLHGAKESVAKGNTIIGLRKGRVSEAGDGVSVWNAPGAKVIGNDISFGRDGIFTKTSKLNVFSGNRLHSVRFAIHYMYTNQSEIIGNRSERNNVGYAIMYSDRLRVVDNVSDGDRDHGLLLNYANASEIRGNVVRGRLQPVERWTGAAQIGGTHGVPSGRQPAGVERAGMRLGPEKCVFIYNANRNRFLDNWFEGCGVGIHFTAGSEGNAISGNAFIRNRHQVKYVGSRYLDWSAEGRGNYWSDNPAFDLDGDGVADNPYRPNDLVDRVLWTSPQAKVLMNSPAVQVIRWAQSQFPAILPGGVVDSRPMMAPPQARGDLQ